MGISEISIEKRLSMNAANGFSTDDCFKDHGLSDDNEAILALTTHGYRVLVPHIWAYKDGSGLVYEWRCAGAVYSPTFDDKDIIEWWELPQRENL
jgi:hypothetical protein